jgi:DNA-binding GntR family transcriptional regulator
MLAVRKSTERNLRQRYAFLARAPRNERRGHLATTVETALREAILNLDLVPGAMLEKQLICDQLGVSRFPVSAAMATLAKEGLVEVLPQRGTRVTRIALSDIRQELFIRRALESELVGAIAPVLSAQVLDVLDTNLKGQRRAVAADDQRTFHHLDLEFHQILLDTLNLPRVKTVVGSARNNLDRARRLMATPSRIRQTLREHARIAKALREHDPEGASRAMRAHLDAVAEELHRFAGQRPDLFEGGHEL